MCQPLLDDKQRIADDRQGQRNLQGNQHDASLVVAHGGENRFDLHVAPPQFDFSCQAGCTCAARHAGYNAASTVATIALSKVIAISETSSCASRAICG